MPLNTNFNPTVGTDGTVLHVMGSSEVPEGTELISRHIALQQGETVAEGPATLGPSWMAHPRLSAEGFEAGDAMAIGTETHFSGPPALFVSVTWAEIVEIEEIEEAEEK